MKRAHSQVAGRSSKCIGGLPYRFDVDESLSPCNIDVRFAKPGLSNFGDTPQ
jgi:hypothetical protein